MTSATQRFLRCYESDGMMWCQHFNKSWAPPFPATSSNSKEIVKEKSSEEIISTDDNSIKKV